MTKLMPPKKESITKVVTFKHPGLNNRMVSVIFVNNRLDMPSFMFLCNEAVTGGRKSSVAGKMSHKGRAYKIAELYQYLHDMGLTWDTCEEHHIEQIRNAMLHWNEYGEYAKKSYMIIDKDGNTIPIYEKIENDTMNQKLSVWFKFFRYQKTKQRSMRIILSTQTIEITVPDAKLQHLYGKKIGQNKLMVERWDLMIKPSPTKLYFPALSKTEYDAFKSQLTKIDPAYAAIAELGVATGLRKDALLLVKPDFFKNTFIEINQGGRTFKEGFRSMAYENKGGATEYVKVPIRAIKEVNHLYMAALRKNRMLENASSKFSKDSDYMWYRADGKKIETYNLDDAFRKASKAMRRTQGIDNITVHHLRHTFATWAVLDGAKTLNIDLMQLDGKMVPGLIFWVKEQLAHVSDETTAKYIVSAILMTSPKITGPVLDSSMINKSKVLIDLLEADAKLHFGRDYDPTKFDPMTWAEFKHFDMESANIIALKKHLGV